MLHRHASFHPDGPSPRDAFASDAGILHRDGSPCDGPSCQMSAAGSGSRSPQCPGPGDYSDQSLDQGIDQAIAPHGFLPLMSEPEGRSLPFTHASALAVQTAIRAQIDASPGEVVLQPSPYCPIGVKNLVIIDSALQDYEDLAFGVWPTHDVVILNGYEDGVAQITAILERYSYVETLHLVSHGTPGCLILGNTRLNLEQVATYGSHLQRWFDHAVEQVDRRIIIYGCTVGARSEGRQFLAHLHAFTGATIIASSTKTGHAALGGNWTFDVQVPAPSPDTSALEPWAGPPLSPVAIAFKPEILTTYIGILSSVKACVCKTCQIRGPLGQCMGQHKLI